MAEDFGSIARQWLGNPKDNLGCFVLEAGFVGAAEATVVTARKGRCVWTIEGMGVEGHSGNAHQTSRNAIVHLCDAVKSISDLTDYSKDVTVNVGVIHGGRGVNTVPGYAYAEVCFKSAWTVFTSPLTKDCRRLRCERQTLTFLKVLPTKSKQYWMIFHMCRDREYLQYLSGRKIEQAKLWRAVLAKLRGA